MYIELYTVYEPHHDITFIMEEIYKDNEIVSKAVVGFHHGEPDESTKQFIGKTKATYTY